MKVFIKYVLKSMTEKKGRFLLLLIAIAMSTGLVVTSTGLIDIILDSLLKPMVTSYEEQDLVIEPNDKGLSFFTCNDLNTAGIESNRIIREININGTITDNIDTDDETMRSVTIRARANSEIPLEQLTNNLTIHKGEFVSIMGPSRSGKSTLLYLLGGLDKPTSGSVMLEDTNLSSIKHKEMSKLRRSKIGFVFQFYNLVPNLTVEDNIFLPVILDGENPKKYEKKLADILDTIGLSDKRKLTPSSIPL